MLPRNRRTCPWTVVLAVVALTACDDGDSPSEPGTDALLDVVATDAVDDAQGDVLADTDTGPTPAVCGDGVVEGEEACDGAAAGATCQGLLGTYGTEATKGDPGCGSGCAFDTSACQTVTCDANATPVGARCAELVEPDAYVPSDTVAYVSTVDISASGPQPPCCFDLDGDGQIDNALKDLLNGFAASGTGGLDLSEAMDDAVQTGELLTLVEFGDFPGLPGAGEAVSVSFFRASNDLDDDGMLDQDGPTRANGQGVFRLDRSSFGTAGSQSQLVGTLSDGVLTGRDGHLELDVVAPGFFALTIAVEDVRIAFELEPSGAGIASTTDTIDVNGTAVDVYRAELGGIVQLSELVRVVNDLVDDCACAGVSTGDALLALDDAGKLTCSDLTFDDTACTGELVDGDGFVCSQLTLLCGATTVLSALPDIDTDGDGVSDALSTGVRMRLAPATLDAIPVQPEAP